MYHIKWILFVLFVSAFIMPVNANEHDNLCKYKKYVTDSKTYNHDGNIVSYSCKGYINDVKYVHQLHTGGIWEANNNEMCAYKYFVRRVYLREIGTRFMTRYLVYECEHKIYK